MISVGRLIMPFILVLKNELDTITLCLPAYGTQSYLDDSECFLHFNFSGSVVHIDYYCEDDYYLSERFDLDDFASGDLKTETFEAIQERALKVLCKYIENDQKEMLDHFRDL